MGADEVAVIRPALLELEADLASAGDSGPLCATFEVEPDFTRWLQVVFGTPDTLNLFYPFDDSPLEKLQAIRMFLPPNLRLTSYEPRAFATFSFTRPSAMELARFLDAVFVGILECDEKEYPLTVRLERLAI